MKKGTTLIILGFYLTMQALLGTSQVYADSSNQDFFDYVNNQKWKINSVMVLGVGASDERAQKDCISSRKKWR